MRRTAAIALSLVLIIALLMSGCASYPNLTAEQDEMISEYAVSLLLKYDSENHSRLIDTSEFMNMYNTALKIREDGIAAYEAEKAAEEEARRAEAEAQQTSMALTDNPSGGSNNDGTGGATVIDSSTASISIEEFLNANDFSISYSGFDIKNSYPDESTDYFFSMDSTTGNDLLVIYFDVKNNGSAQTLNIFGMNTTFKLNINNQGFHSAFKTMLEDDLSEYLGDFAAGESKKLVLIYEVPEGTAVSSIELSLSSNSKGSITKPLLY